MIGALLEVDIDKICTTPARANDSDVKIDKNWRSRDVFWGSKCVSRGRRRDFDTLRNTWQAQEFVRVAKTLASVGDLKRVWNDAFRVAGAVIWRFVMSMFEASDAETVEGLQISCHGSLTLQWSFRVAVTGLRMPRLNFFVAGAVLLKHPLKNRENVLEFWGQVFAQHVNFEGSLAEMLRFWSSKLCFWRKSRRKASFLSFKASILKEVSQKSFVWQNNLNHTSVDNQLTWTSNHLTAKSLESQINWQPTHLNLRSIDNQLSGIRNQLTNKINRIAHRLTTKSLESQINWEPTLESRIDWQPNHLNLKAIDNQINWISDQLTTSSLESQINWQPNSFEARIDWQPNHLNLKSVDNQITWISNHSTSKSLEFRINRQPNDLNPKSIDNQNHLNLTSLQSDFNWLSNQLNPARPPSYRFLIFGNFRHRLVR